MDKKESTSEKLKLDQIMKLLFKLSKKVTINLLNALFNEDYKSDEVTIEYGNGEFLDDDYNRIKGDMFINVYRKEFVYRYHIEFQTLNDTGMVIRMFKYGFEKAMETLDISSEKEIRLEFPKQRVIFLEENQNIADSLSMVLIMPDGQEIKYKVPVMKYWKYTPADLEKQKMYALLPLQVFKSRKKIDSIYESKRPEEEKAQLINQEFEKLKETVAEVLNILSNLYDKHEIFSGDLKKILDVLTNINDYLYSKYGKYRDIDKEVTAMIKTVYDPKVKEEGKEEGKIEGKKEGKIEYILNILNSKFDTVPGDLKEKILSIEDESKLDNLFMAVIKSDSISDIYRMI